MAKGAQKVIEVEEGFLEESESTYPKLFGRYLLLDKLTNGGMGDICLARYIGNSAKDNIGAEKLVTIKMVSEEKSSNQNLKKMFPDEIRIIFGLTHPNIVQTFDYGFVEGQLYISMEFVEGVNLREVIKRLKFERKRLGIPATLFIIKTIASALHYAHNYKDKLSGKEFNLIHRDVSPDNIMITFEGEVKLIDFGIAKTDVNSEATQTGTIKGKYSYIGPEYISGDCVIDHRYDQFGLGLVMWELITGKRVFPSESKLTTLSEIIECKIEVPSKFNNKVDKELDSIILKAMAKNPDDRYENMEEFNKVLSAYLNRKSPEFHSGIIKKYSQSLFKDQIKKNRDRYLDFGKIDPRNLIKKAAKRQGKVVEINLNPETRSLSVDYANENTGDHISAMEDGHAKVRSQLTMDFEEPVETSGIIKDFEIVEVVPGEFYQKVDKKDSE